ncbi:hypothetical protein GWI33_013893 [Rhynchophorus ferrugineus]|uniref:Uncharacterized protein n=1 Tax=Rhynchophorus ferrugineus TaxID=354439 RepID=A0A834I658_RHYFE|nr:hypothetical protein GWI33_013893 [Rhynchophorus ferrugineus]
MWWRGSATFAADKNGAHNHATTVLRDTLLLCYWSPDGSWWGYVMSGFIGAFAVKQSTSCYWVPLYPIKAPRAVIGRTKWYDRVFGRRPFGTNKALRFLIQLNRANTKWCPIFL